MKPFATWLCSSSHQNESISPPCDSEFSSVNDLLWPMGCQNIDSVQWLAKPLCDEACSAPFLPWKEYACAWPTGLKRWAGRAESSHSSQSHLRSANPHQIPRRVSEIPTWDQQSHPTQPNLDWQNLLGTRNDRFLLLRPVKPCACDTAVFLTVADSCQPISIRRSRDGRSLWIPPLNSWFHLGVWASHGVVQREKWSETITTNLSCLEGILICKPLKC